MICYPGVVEVGPLLSRVFQFLDLYQTFGIARATHLAARWAIRREFIVAERNLRTPLPTLPPVDSSRWTRLTDADIAHVRRINPALCVAEIRRRLEEGQTCLLYWLGDVLVHYTWRTMRPAYLPYLRKTIWPLEGDVFVVESFTHPPFRGQGIHVHSVNWTAREAKDSGLCRRLSMVPWWATPSLQALSRNGCTMVGTVGYWNGGLQRSYFATGDVRLNHAGVFVRSPTARTIAD